MSDFNIRFNEVERLLSIFERLAKSLKGVVSFPESQRVKMREGLSEAAELVHTLLSLVRQKLHDIITTTQSDPSKARPMIAALANVEEWEDGFRKLRLCGPLCDAANDVTRGIICRVSKHVVFKDANSMQAAVNCFLQGEEKTAEGVAFMLEDLAKLETIVEASPKKVVSRLTKARKELQEHRASFAALEARIRKSI